MTNTLNDSEDFIADTPPAHVMKQQWREPRSEVDGNKVISSFFIMLSTLSTYMPIEFF